MPDRTSKPATQAERMMREVEAKRRRGERHEWSWSSIDILGVVGWSVTVPTLLGIAAGIWIDRHYPSRFSWTLMLLLGGLMLGCFHAWMRLKGNHHD